MVSQEAEQGEATRTWSSRMLCPAIKSPHAGQEALHAVREFRCDLAPKARPVQIHDAAVWRRIEHECRAYLVLACRMKLDLRQVRQDCPRRRAGQLGPIAVPAEVQLYDMTH